MRRNGGGGLYRGRRRVDLSPKTKIWEAKSGQRKEKIIQEYRNRHRKRAPSVERDATRLWGGLKFLDFSFLVSKNG